MNNTYFQNLLLRSFEQSLSDAEQLQLEQALQNNPDWQAQYAQYKATRQQLQGYKPNFAPQFADRVMANWQLNGTTKHHDEPPQNDHVLTIMLLWFPKIAAAAAIIIGIIAINTYQQEGKLSFDTLAGLNYIDSLADDENDQATFYLSN
jgi:hypothetical protein